MIKRGTVIQANENAKDWCGTLLMVDEDKGWGVMAHVHVPMQGDAYIRLTNEQFDNLGVIAPLIPIEEDE